MPRSAACNGLPTRYTIKGSVKWFILLLIGSERAHVVKYLYTLRHLEYWTNRPSSLGRNTIRRCWSVRLSLLSHRYGIYIRPNIVGEGLKIPHFAGGIIINCERMGRHCIINTGVVIGNKDKSDARPEIGDNVEFAMGCKVYGKILIGNNVRIAPNAVVFKDIPSYTAVGGNPAKVIKTYDKY